jgi:hypothetical protein
MPCSIAPPSDPVNEPEPEPEPEPAPAPEENPDSSPDAFRPGLAPIGHGHHSAATRPFRTWKRSTSPQAVSTQPSGPTRIPDPDRRP